ncbi:hypothetical protein [Chamaesiphon polymorphus]|uniref:hypothetical protein n=1 Tax=Chamaesiphon polymorphus TaxID=2107691 RepID=UPI0015E69E1D|nr:hypothetical protein [Chamaesiphon polymorphus]
MENSYPKANDGVFYSQYFSVKLLAAEAVLNILVCEGGLCITSYDFSRQQLLTKKY